MPFKKIILFFCIAAFFMSMYAPFLLSQGMKTNVAREEVLTYLSDIVKLFDRHAKEMGGTNFFYGLKSKVMTLYTYRHRKELEEKLLWTPEYMLYASGIKEDDPALARTFEKYCRTMPTTYDTYETCGKKIRNCVRMLFPEKDDIFYEGEINKIRKATGADWL